MAAPEGVDDAHGFFQFAAGSDSDDDDDGLFGATRDRTRRIDVSQINYTPRIDEDGWFDRTGTIDAGEWLARHLGLDEIIYTAQRSYFKRAYAPAANLCKQTVAAYTSDTRGPRRIANIREVLEIGARSAMRVGDTESVQFFYDWYLQCGGRNPGYNGFLAEALAALDRPAEALGQYVEYLEQRRQDAAVWEAIGQLLVEISQKSEHSGPARAVLLRLALGAFCRSHAIIDGCRNWKDMDIAVRRRQLQTQELFRKAAAAAQLLGVRADTDIDTGNTGDDADAWRAFQSASLADQAGQAAWLGECPEPLSGPASWIAAQTAGGVQGDRDTSDADDDECGGRN
ncbi:hypothetical protein H4R19_006044, partial [Coemansia spiralis]